MTRAPFSAWKTTQEGRAAVDEAATRTRFSLLGRARSAGRRLWRQLVDAVRDDAIVNAIEIETQAYLPRLGGLAFAAGLPRGSVELRRLGVVPTVLLNTDAYTAIAKRLVGQQTFVTLEGGRALRDFFITTLVGEMEAAAAGARPSPRRPLAAGTDWITVGVNTAFVWRLPLLQEPAWDGHHYVLEVTRDPITRAVRKAIAARIERFEASLPTLPRAERNEILRRARSAA
jgi:hypothetical protein